MRSGRRPRSDGFGEGFQRVVRIKRIDLTGNRGFGVIWTAYMAICREDISEVENGTGPATSTRADAVVVWRCVAKSGKAATEAAAGRFTYGSSSSSTSDCEKGPSRKPVEAGRGSRADGRVAYPGLWCLCGIQEGRPENEWRVVRKRECCTEHLAGQRRRQSGDACWTGARLGAQLGGSPNRAGLWNVSSLTHVGDRSPCTDHLSEAGAGGED